VLHCVNFVYINVFVLCFIVWVLCMSIVWLTLILETKQLIAMTTVLLKTETDSKLFLKLTFASAVKMSPKRTEWDTSQSAPKN
jgi:hypothetical protein